jgi:OOP family OmpA-OmpF porin
MVLISLRRALVSCVLVACSAVPALAQTDADGSKDHPAVPRMPGYVIGTYEAKDFDGFEFPTGEDTAQRVEGKYWAIDYEIKEGAKAASALQISRNYRNAFAAKGGTQRWVDADAIHTTLVLRTRDAELWCHVNVSNSGEMYTLTIVERSAMAQDVDLTAEGLAKALRDTGAVALRNILFDTGKATIKAESAAALSAIVELLKNDASLRLEIQGHTDNTGTPAANRSLSQQRAEAVRDYLVTKGGIAAARLTAVGLGDTKPVAPNTDDAGRAQNRRVELHKK